MASDQYDYIIAVTTKSQGWFCGGPAGLPTAQCELLLWFCSRPTVGFHNFNLRIYNLRVSNPNKLIAGVFLTRCRISMCQGLGPTKTMEFRKSTVFPLLRVGPMLQKEQKMVYDHYYCIYLYTHTHYIYIYIYMCIICIYTQLHMVSLWMKAGRPQLGVTADVPWHQYLHILLWHIHIYIYIYTHIHTCIHTHILLWLWLSIFV